MDQTPQTTQPAHRKRPHRPDPNVPQNPRGTGPRTKRTRLYANPLRDWLERPPKPMSKARFAQLVGITTGYVSMLVADDPPYPKREVQLRIAAVTEGCVTPNDLAGYPPGD
jgi:hypothetical protein